PSGTLKLTIDRLAPECVVTIFDAAGEKIVELKTGKKIFIEWDGKKENKEAVTEGSYTYVIKTKEGAEKKGKFEVKK
ncbi:MAG: gliding motility-associated C-terminal domain-containing protein, partial [Candidatus Firestonebacteria bacterium]